jgi:hypothetical protein
MLSKTRRSAAPGVMPDTITGPAANGSSAATDPDAAPVQASAAAANGRETRRERSRRKAHRSRLQGYAILGWLLGLVATAAFHWRTRAPRRGGGTS